MNNLINNLNYIISKVGRRKSIIKEIELENFFSLYYNGYSIGLDHCFSKFYNFISNDTNEFDKLRDICGNNFNIKELISHYNANPVCFYRGATYHGDLLDVTPGERISQDTSNVYNLLMSEMLPSWKGWPKRNRSIIMTNSFSVARKYKDNKPLSFEKYVYMVIPPNDVKLCVSYNSDDIWDSFDDLNAILDTESGGIPILNEVIISLLTLFEYLRFNNYNNNEIKKFIKDNKTITDIDKLHSLSDNLHEFKGTIINYFNNSDITSIMSLFNFMDNFFKKSKSIPNGFIILSLNLLALYNCWADMFKYLLSKYRKNNFDFIATLNKILNPLENGFSNVKFNNFVKSECHQTVELWTESPCLFIAAENSDLKIYFIKSYIENVIKK